MIINTRFAFVHFIYRTYVLGDGRGAQNYFIGGWGGGRLFEVGRSKLFYWGVGLALIRCWALINFSYLKDGRLFEVVAYSRLGA